MYMQETRDDPRTKETTAQDDPQQQEMERIKRQLEQTSQRVERLATEMQKHEALIARQKDEIDDLKGLPEVRERNEGNASPWGIPVVRRFHDSLWGKWQLKAGDWQELEIFLCRQFPQFARLLESSSRLLPPEYRICLLVKAGFTASEIDHLLVKRHSYASNVRKRLLEKLFGKAGSAADFDRIIQQME